MNLPSLFFHKKNNFFPVASLFHSERPVRRKRFKRETVRRKDPAGEKNHAENLLFYEESRQRGLHVVKNLLFYPMKNISRVKESIH